MIELVVKREPTVNGATFGRLVIESPGTLLHEARVQTSFCWTLEDAIRPPGVKVHGQTCIPPGRYRLRFVMSARFGPDTLSLDDVPMFQYIRIHAGNAIDDTDGCILVGDKRSESRIKPWLGESRIALARLKPLVKRWMLVQPELYIRIENP
jgi:hypothetical protein